MSVSAAYKPSHLGHGPPTSPRGSPFRRPESPASPSPLRYTTPTGSPTKGAASAYAERGGASPGSARFERGSTPNRTFEGAGVASRSRAFTGEMTPPPLSPQRPAAAPRTKSLSGGNALSKLQPTQVRTLRDGFQILDRDCDGVVNRDDVADMLNQLGLPSGPSDVAPFFRPSAPQTMPLAAFLNSLAEVLAALSPSAELLSAFSAFDDDDSGQVDLVELRDALINTAPEPGERALTAAEVDKVMNGFTGRRAFSRNMNTQFGTKKGEVFKYREMVNSIMGTHAGSEGPSHENSEA